MNPTIKVMREAPLVMEGGYDAVFQHFKRGQCPWAYLRIVVKGDGFRYDIEGSGLNLDQAQFIAHFLPPASADLQGMKLRAAAEEFVGATMVNAKTNRGPYPEWHLKVSVPGASRFKAGDLFTHKSFARGERIACSKADFSESESHTEWWAAYKSRLERGASKEVPQNSLFRP